MLIKAVQEMLHLRLKVSTIEDTSDSLSCLRMDKKKRREHIRSGSMSDLFQKSGR